MIKYFIMIKLEELQAGVLHDGWKETNNLTALCLHRAQKHFKYIIKTKSRSLQGPSCHMLYCGLKFLSVLLTDSLRQKECFNIESSFHVS